MLELNRAYPAGLFEAQGRYSEFLARRDEFLRGQAAYQESLANTVRREIEWLRRGAKARSTKAKGRIQDAGRLIDELAESRARSLSATAGHRLHLLAASHAPAGRRPRRRQVARGPATLERPRPVITPGTRVGLIGPNGSGKTTLLERARRRGCAPDAGRGRARRRPAHRALRAGARRPRLRRRACAGRWRPRATPSSGRAGAFTSHSWAKRFLFRPEQLEVPVGRLSGGEQARILIARLMREPADLLVLDEPTNDLDIPTLEVLEDSLAEFDGGLILVTHDRFMLERVSTRDPGPRRARAAPRRSPTTRSGRPPATPRPRRRARPPSDRPSASARAPRRLGYHEQREWDGMEQAILDAERRTARRRSAPRTIRRSPSDSAALQAALRRARGRPRRGRPALRALGGARGQAGLRARASWVGTQVPFARGAMIAATRGPPTWHS